MMRIAVVGFLSHTVCDLSVVCNKCFAKSEEKATKSHHFLKRPGELLRTSVLQGTLVLS